MAIAADGGRETIFALSSGRLPAAIAVMRVSGPAVEAVLETMIGTVPPARRAGLRLVRNERGEPIDRALVLRFPGPRSATGEDLAEFHFHGSRAVVSAAARTFAGLGCREAEPGEFTRRALLAGRIDVAEAEALADLLEAETENQHRDALRRVGGAMGRLVAEWTDRLTILAAGIEHLLDYDENDGDPGPSFAAIHACRIALDAVLAAPAVDRVRDGFRVVLSGPPNAGKSSLFNRILGFDAAIVSPRPGTTRDLSERPVAIGGIGFVLVDAAGMRPTDDPIEADGVSRAREAAAGADIVIDLGDGAPTGGVRIPVSAQCDRVAPQAGRIATSATTGEGIDILVAAIADAGRRIGGATGTVALDQRHRAALTCARDELVIAETEDDIAIVAGRVGVAVRALSGLSGMEASDAVLSTLFARFCVGK